MPSIGKVYCRFELLEIYTTGLLCTGNKQVIEIKRRGNLARRTKAWLNYMYGPFVSTI